MLQRLPYRKIPHANRFILEVVITVQIDPLFATILNMVMHICGGLRQYLQPKNLQKSFSDRVVSNFQEKVRSTSVLRREH